METTTSALTFGRDTDSITTGRIVLGAILSVLACALLVIFTRYLILLPVSDVSLEKAGGSLLMGKAEQIIANITDGNMAFTWVGEIVALALLPIVGLCAGFMDDALCMLPLGRSIRSHVGFEVTWPVRLAPAILFGVYFVIAFAVEAFNPEGSIVIEHFSWKGEGYTPGMWVSQIFYLLIGLSLLFLVVEALCNSGLIGMVVRVPILLATNLIMAVLISALAAMAFVVVLAVVGLIFALFVVYLFLKILALFALFGG